MIVVLKQDAPDVQGTRSFCHELEDMGLQIGDSKGSDTHILGRSAIPRPLRRAGAGEPGGGDLPPRVRKPTKRPTPQIPPGRQRYRRRGRQDRRQQLYQSSPGRAALKARSRCFLLHPAGKGGGASCCAAVRSSPAPPTLFRVCAVRVWMLLKLARRIPVHHRDQDRGHRAPAPV